MRKLLHSALRLLNPRLRAKLLRFRYGQLQPLLAMLGAARLVGGRNLRRQLRRPQELGIEITSICDADCIMCPRKSMSRRQAPMDMDLFRKIVDEAVALGIPSMSLHGYGEISTLKNYKDYISYIRSKSRDVNIIVTTNGMRMDEEKARFYIESGVNMIVLSVNGATPETYEGIRRHLNLDQVDENIRNLVRIRSELGKTSPLIRIVMLEMPENAHEVGLFFEKWQGVVDNVGVLGTNSRLGAVGYGKDTSKWEDIPCRYLWDQMPILSDGTVALCCDDWDGVGRLGNARDNTLQELWQSNQNRELVRALHMSGQSSKNPICAACRQPRQPSWWFRRHVTPAHRQLLDEFEKTTRKPTPPRTSDLPILN